MFAAPFWKMNMKKNTKMAFAGAGAAVVVVLAAVSVIVFTRDNSGSVETLSSAEGKSVTASAAEPAKEKDPLVGTWQYLDGTKYTFSEGGKGAMTVENYDYIYSYTSDGTNLHIDYEKPEVHDADYTYEVKDTVLHLVGGKGTAGGEYDMNRVG